MLFKILKGASSRISLDVTPFHDGWCYYTSDDGKFYIDSQEEDGSRNRTCINSGAIKEVVDLTLRADGWRGNAQSLFVDGLLENQNGLIGAAQNLTATQTDAINNAILQIGGQADDLLTIIAVGDLPTCDIPITLFLFD